MISRRTVLRWVLPTVLVSLLIVLLMPPLFRHLMHAVFWQQLIDDVDHRMKPGEETGLNSDNIRALREADSIEPDDFNIIVLGDSYMFGFWLSTETAPPAHLEALLREHYGTERINVWNFGWISSSPYLSLRLLRDLGEKYQPDLVILNLDMSDFKDDFFYRSVLERRGNYRYLDCCSQLFFHVKQLTESVSFLRPLHQRWFGYPGKAGYFVARQPGEQSLPYFETVLDSMNQIHEYSRDVLKVPFVAFFPPRHWQYTDREAPDSWEGRRNQFDVLGPHALEPFRYFERVRLPYPLVPLLEDFQQTDIFPLSFKGDSHWNEQGARFAAERMFAHCLNLGCFQALEGKPVAPVAALP